MSTVGFIGLGHMGQPMAINLIKSNYEVYVYDVNVKAVEMLVEQGGKPSKNIAELSQKCDVIITMVQTGQQVKNICLGDQGIFDNARPNTLYIDSSSIDIRETESLHKIAKEKGIAMLEAPVSGGTAGAQAKTLTFMVGGEEKNYLRALPILNKMGAKIIHAGPAGKGQAAKICNNLLLGISMIAVSEAFNLAEKLGLNPQTFFDISSNASGQCWSMTSYCPVPGILPNAPASHDYQPGFMAKMMLKDLSLAKNAAENVSASLPLGTLAMEIYNLYNNQGQGDLDFSGIINFIKGR